MIEPNTDQIDIFVESGDYRSLNSLAKQYREGIGVPKDIDIAIELDRKAYTINRNNSHLFYDDLRKRHKAPDIKEALEVLFDPANKGTEIKSRRASAYLHGYNIERDIPKGLKILDGLSKNSDIFLLKYIDAVIKFGTDDLYRDAFDRCQSIANLDSAKSRLALMYASGIGTAKDLDMAATTYLEIHDYSNAVKCFLEIGSHDADSKAKEVLVKMDESADKFAYLGVLEHRESGPNEPAIELMKTSALLKKPWAEDAMNDIATQKTDPEWKYEVYSTFANISDKDTSLSILANYPADPSKNGIHETEMDLLKNLLKYASEINVDVIADGGTLLGSVRHHGFIPWDDDLDVRMFEEDIILLKDYLSVNSSDNYVIETYAYGRFYKFYSVSHGGWIDLFPIESQVFHGDDYSVFKNKVSSINDPSITCIYYRAVRDTQPLASKSYFEEHTIYPLKKATFDNIVISIPNDSDKVLTSFYGRYYHVPDKQGIHNSDVVNERVYKSFIRSKNSDEGHVDNLMKVIRRYISHDDSEHARLWALKIAEYMESDELYDLIKSSDVFDENYLESLNTVIKSGKYSPENNPIIIKAVKAYTEKPEDVSIIIELYDSLIKSDSEKSKSLSFTLLSSIPEQYQPKFYNLWGKSYHHGIGITADLNKSADYFRRSYSKPIWAQLEFFDVLRAIGTEDSYNEMIAVAESNLSGKKANPWMMGRLGTAYIEGTGVTPDLEKARFWLEKAASKGVPWAKKKLEKISRQS